MKDRTDNTKTFGIANKYILFGLIVIASVSIAVSGQISEAFVDYFHGDGSNITGIVQPNTVIYKIGSTIYAKNGTTGAIDASSTSFSSVVTSALTNGSVKIKDGNYVATSVIEIPAGRTVEGESWSTHIQAGGGSGNSIFKMNSFTTIKNIEFVNSSINDIPILIVQLTNGQHIENNYFFDFYNSNVIPLGDRAGENMIISGNYFTTKNATKFEIVLSNDSTCCGSRQIVNNQAGGYNMTYFNASQNTYFAGNFLVNINLTNDTAKPNIVGNRFATAGDQVIINGIDGTFVSNIVAGRINVANATDWHISNNVQVGGETIDSSRGFSSYLNYIEQNDVSYTPVWSSTGVAPSLGSGTLLGTYSRSGNTVTATINLYWAADTTGGTGFWSFSLPYSSSARVSSRRWEGVGHILDTSEGTWIMAGGTVGSGVSTMTTYYNSSSIMTATLPITWATGDELHVTITYFV